MREANFKADKGVNSEVLITIVLDMARAGAIFHESMASGKFLT